MKYNIIYADPAWKYNDKPNKRVERLKAITRQWI